IRGPDCCCGNFWLQRVPDLYSTLEGELREFLTTNASVRRTEHPRFPRIDHPESWQVSFRDPLGRVFRVGDRIVRIVSTSGESTLKAFLSSRAAGDLTSSGALVASSYLDKAECRRVLATVSPGFDAVREQLPLIVEHERI